jgi:hypothetical protein
VYSEIGFVELHRTRSLDSIGSWKAGAPMKRKNRKSPKRRKLQRRKRSRTTPVKRGVRKHRPIKRKKPVRSNKPTDPRIALGLRLMRRDGLSASQAVRKAKIKLQTFVRGAGNVLYRSGPGKPWKVRTDDKLRFFVKIVTDFGARSVVARNLRERQLASAHNFAVRMWRAGEDGAEARLKEFDGKTVGGYKLITDTKLLTQLEEAGLLDFENLYGSFGDPES